MNLAQYLIRTLNFCSQRQLWLLMGGLMIGCQPVLNFFAFHPDRQFLLQESQLPQGIKEVQFSSLDGETLFGLFLPDSASKHLLLYFQGNAGNIYHRIEDLQTLNEMGMNVLGLSYRGYGKSTGSPSEKGIYQDGKAALNYAQNELGFKFSNIILFGRSIGSAVAVELAQKNDFGAMILVSPITSAKAQAKASGMGALASLAGDAFNNLEKVKNITTPVLIIHGKEDQIIPYQMGREIYNAINAPKEFVEIPRAGHNDLSSGLYPQYWQAVEKFVTKKMD